MGKRNVLGINHVQMEKNGTTIFSGGFKFQASSILENCAIVEVARLTPQPLLFQALPQLI